MEVEVVTEISKTGELDLFRIIISRALTPTAPLLNVLQP